MSALLVEALRGLRLQRGQVYRASVDGQTVELRIAEEPTSEITESVMLEPWVEFPFEAIGTAQASLGGVPMPDPPVIPTDGELP